MLCLLNYRRLLWTSYLAHELNLQAECSSLEFQRVVHVAFFERFIAKKVCTGCSRTNSTIFPQTNLNNF